MNNIVVIGVNFFPEDTSTGLYTTQMAEFLSQKGFDVSVITGFPYYPQWEIWKDYRDKPDYLEEDYEGIKVFRFRQFTPSNPSFLKRIRHILSFTFGSLRNLKKIKNADLIIAIVPFTSDIWLAHKLAKKHNAKVWVHVQDFEFDAAFESGVVKGGFIKKILSAILYRVETKLLNKSDIVSTISFSMLNKAQKKTSSEVYYFPNWVDQKFINPKNAKKHRYLTGNKFKMLYSGNIGAKQDWEKYIEFVSSFEGREDVEFVVVGDGAKKEWLLSRIKDFKNVKYYPPVPYEELPDLLCGADLHLLFQKESVVDTVMPSKLLGMMASGRPSLVTGNPKSEVADVMNESGGGKFFNNAHIRDTVEFVDQLIKNRQLAYDFGKKAEEYVAKNFSKNAVLGKFTERVKEIIEKEK